MRRFISRALLASICTVGLIAPQNASAATVVNGGGTGTIGGSNSGAGSNVVVAGSGSSVTYTGTVKPSQPPPNPGTMTVIGTASQDPFISTTNGALTTIFDNTLGPQQTFVLDLFVNFNIPGGLTGPVTVNYSLDFTNPAGVVGFSQVSTLWTDFNETGSSLIVGTLPLSTTTNTLDPQYTTTLGGPYNSLELTETFILAAGAGPVDVTGFTSVIPNATAPAPSGLVMLCGFLGMAALVGFYRQRRLIMNAAQA
jgi:hypothetical protein